MAPTTRCKFRCTGVTLRPPNYGTLITLEATYPEDSDGFKHGEDHAFFSATPTGKLEMTVNNPYGAELFQPGDSGACVNVDRLGDGTGHGSPPRLAA